MRSMPNRRSSNPYYGQHLRVGRAGGLYTHHGIGSTRGKVIHYASFSRFGEKGPIEEVSLEQFAAGQPIEIVRHRRRKYDRREAVRRARSRLGEDGYSLWANNCEHFAVWCITGEHRSEQVDHTREWLELAAEIGDRVCGTEDLPPHLRVVVQGVAWTLRGLQAVADLEEDERRIQYAPRIALRGA